MSNLQRIALGLMGMVGLMATGLLVTPGDAGPAPLAPVSVLGPTPTLEAAPSAVPIGPRVAAAADGAPSAARLDTVTPGVFAPRPRPPAVVAFGAAAPLAPGQDVSGYYWGGVKPDLSD